MDHVSTHTKGIELSEEVKYPNNRDLVAAIKDFQRAQATMWVELQFLRQRTSTPQTPQEVQAPQGKTKRLNLVPPQNQNSFLN